MKQIINIFWFRRDLRLNDNSGLFHALNSGIPVLPVFIFDKEILLKLVSKKDARITFINNEIKTLKTEIQSLGSSLKVIHDDPKNAFKILLNEFEINSVYTNNDYEPQAISRDEEIKKLLISKCINFFSFKDLVVFEKKEIVKNDGSPYTVFTPFSKKWKSTLREIESFRSEDLISNFFIRPCFNG